MDLATAEGLLSDPEMRDFAQEEIDDAKARLETLEQGLQVLLLPRDPNDERNIFLEIRAGVITSYSIHYTKLYEFQRTFSVAKEVRTATEIGANTRNNFV